MSRAGFSKRGPGDLALFGGEPLFPKALRVGQPNVPDVGLVLDDFRKILTSGTLTNNGPCVQAFEERLREVCGAAHVVATCNATAALELVAKALGLSGEVIVPSFTFIATAHALSWQGLTPVFADVEADGHTIDPRSVEAAITPSTSAICGVHLWGNVCDVDALQRIADRHGLALWFDAAHAFSATRGGIDVGNFGAAEVFSFHATKFVNAFEGGAIATNDGELAGALREMRNFGFVEGREREVVRPGINAKMTEVSAAMGLRSLQDLDGIRAANRRNAARYRAALSRCKGLRIGAPVAPETSNCQYSVIEVDAREAGLSRDQLLRVLVAEGVVVKPYFAPGCHRAAPYTGERASTAPPLTVTDRLVESVLVLPMGRHVSENDIDRIGRLVRFVTDSAGEVRERLARSG